MKTERKRKSYFLETLTAIIVAIIISLILILLSALLIKVANIQDKYFTVIKQVVKGISVFVACIICLRLPNNGWLRGIIVGILYIILAFFIFSALDGEIKFGLSLLNDIAIGSITGLISGIFAMLIRSKSHSAYSSAALS